MTTDILQSDIDFARRLVEANRRDDEVIAALCQRCLEVGKASQILHDLRCGVPVKPELVVAPDLKEHRKSYVAYWPKQTGGHSSPTALGPIVLFMCFFFCGVPILLILLVMLTGGNSPPGYEQFMERWGR